jgi:hypothetical protein
MMTKDERTVLYTIIGLAIFAFVILPIIIVGPKPFGAGPQPSSTGGGAGS